MQFSAIWEPLQVTMPITIGGYISIVTTFLVGTWLICHKSRNLMLILMLLSGVAATGIALSANAGNYALYYASIVLVNITMAALLIVGTAICTTWFVKTRGRMLGIVTIGAPFSTAVMVPVFARLMAVTSFSNLFIVFGIIIFILGLLMFFFVPSRPEDVGLHADGSDDVSVVSDTDTSATKEWSLRKLAATKEAWLIMLAFGIMMLVSNCVMPLLIPRFLEIGISQNIALNLMSIAALVGIPLSYMWGWMDDKFGTRKACLTLAAGFTLMSVAMVLANSGNLIVVALAVVGIACVTGGSPNLNPSMIVNVFGASEYLNVNRYMMIGQNILRLLALVMMNSIFEATGSYTIGYVVCIGLSIVAFFCFFAIRKRYSTASN
jgi:MFS family permease